MILHDLILKYLPNITITNSWKRINCPLCVYRGEPRPDKKKSGSYIFNYDGEIKYTCFRCKANFYWQPYISLKKNHEEFLGILGADTTEIENAKIEILKNYWKNNQSDTNISNSDKLEKNTKICFPLPDKAKSLKYWIKKENHSKNFIDVCNYLFSRGTFFVSAYKYYWSPEKLFSRRLIVPFYKNGEIVGYSARAIDENVNPKYYMKRPKNYLFNADTLYTSQKYVFIVEGIFDAIAVNGIAICGSNINREQVDFLKNFDKEYIIVPDRSKTTTNFIDIAEKNQWWVSVVPSFHYDDKPVWQPEIKDCADAVKNYGRLYTIYSLLENKTKNYTKSKIIYNSMVGNKK